MALSRADAIADITLLPTEEGGRAGPTAPGSFACLVVVDGQKFAVRFDLAPMERLSPGTTRSVSMRFLDPVRAEKVFKAGTRFDLREGRMIGQGLIRKVSFGQNAPLLRRLPAAGE